ncbi:MAG: PPC domain-containing protein, partial [Treponema sp.]|nr:PPC domain-containing protein [Treponema sp.]
MGRIVVTCVVFVCLGFRLFAQNSGDDPYEPDSRERPVAIQMGTWFPRALHRGDEDWFTLRSASTGLLIAVTGGDTDTVVTLYRGNEAVAQNDDSGDDITSLLEYPVQSGVDYTLCVEGYDEDAVGPYRFMVSFESIRDVGEPNNVVSQATSFRPDSRITGYFLDPDDVDWYRVSVATAGTLRVYTEGSMDTVLLMYSANNELIAEDDDSGDTGNALVSAGVTPGTVFVRVSAYDGQLGRYTLRGLLFEAATPDRFEPDDTPALAKDIAAGASQERNFTDSSDEDWARLRITRQGTYDIFAEAADASLDTFLELYDSDENLVDANDDW